MTRRKGLTPQGECSGESMSDNPAVAASCSAHLVRDALLAKGELCYRGCSLQPPPWPASACSARAGLPITRASEALPIPVPLRRNQARVLTLRPVPLHRLPLQGLRRRQPQARLPPHHRPRRPRTRRCSRGRYQPSPMYAATASTTARPRAVTFKREAAELTQAVRRLLPSPAFSRAERTTLRSRPMTEPAMKAGFRRK